MSTRYGVQCGLVTQIKQMQGVREKAGECVVIEECIRAISSCTGICVQGVDVRVQCFIQWVCSQA